MLPEVSASLNVYLHVQYTFMYVYTVYYACTFIYIQCIGHVYIHVYIATLYAHVCRS